VTETSVTPFATEVVKVEDLKAHPQNYRGHPDDQVAHLQESLREHGQYRNIVVARDGTILAGHGVWEAAKAVGLDEEIVYRYDIDPDDPRAIKLMVGDNEGGRLAEVDDRLLADHLKMLAELDSLLGTGFDEAMLANLVYITRHADEIATIDEAAQWVGMPGFEPAPPDRTMVVHFDSLEDQQAFVDQLGITLTRKDGMTWSGWWPPRPKDDVGHAILDG
jgi:hypothetical protein